MVGLWLATRPSLSPQARMLAERNALVLPGPADRQGAARGPAEAVTIREHETLDTPPTRKPVRPARTVEKVEHDTAPKPAIYKQPKKITPQRIHVVLDGETLSEISYDYYGSAVKWRKIFEANRLTIKNANVVMPGTKLIIPN